MARHASPSRPAVRRALLALATTGVALGAGAATASADASPVVDVPHTLPAALGETDPQAGTQALTGTVGHVTGPVAGLKPNPLAGTGVDPLDNGVATQLDDFRPLSSQALTRPVAEAESIGAIPVLGQATTLLGG
ncbi:hypothetical protein ABT301_29465 [Streptomyces sp. NPDC000987]|uniref:hypothetical protein n=1 Tax=Streptomyces sp. NPDC000987 TaxID=3154374 RepID=UPI00332D999F